MDAVVETFTRIPAAVADMMTPSLMIQLALLAVTITSFAFVVRSAIKVRNTWRKP